MAESLTFGGKAISLGIGLNVGRVFIGNVGGHESGSLRFWERRSI